MNKEETLKRILDAGVVGIVRMNDSRRVLKVLEALTGGGISALEITLTIPGALDLIREVVKAVQPGILIGAGTVLDASAAHSVIDAGAAFVVSPVFTPGVIAVCRERNVPSMPGCVTPTEIYQAWTAGADIVKLFPAKQLGPQYLRDISGPLPHVRIMPTSITIDSVPEWIAAGAVAVGVGSDLLDKQAIAEERYGVITERARALVAAVREARAKRN